MERIVLGISGYLASGKSLAGKFFESQGAFFIDADAVVSELYHPGRDGHRKVIQYFGEQFLKKDGQIDRVKLGRFVFTDENKLKILNHIIHPLVTSEIQKQLDRAKQTFIVIEASYFESKQLGKLVNKILWVDSPQEILLERALKRSGMTPEYFRNILRVQQKPVKIDFTVQNDGSLKSFYTALEEIWSFLH